MRISVWITSYNQKAYLKEAIDSVINQTHKPYQIIIVDDCSSDGSQNLIRAYKNNFPELIHPIFHKQNTGVAQVRIDALNAVEGDLVTYLDGDDWYLPEKLESELGCMLDNPGCDIVFSNHQNKNEDGSKVLFEWVESNDDYPPEGDVFQEVFTRNFPRKSLYKMELVNYNAWKKIGFHDSNLAIYEDYDMRIRLSKYLKVKYNPRILSEIRLHGQGLSRSNNQIYISSLEYLFKKNLALLKDLDPEQSRRILDSIKSILRNHYRKELRACFRRKQIFRAFTYLVKHQIPPLN